MVGIDRLEAFSEAAVKNCTTLKSWEMVTAESDLKDVIEQVKEFPLLVTVLPGASGDDRNYDNVAENNEAMFLVLYPIKEKMTRRQRVDSWKLTQQGMKELKKYIHEQMNNQYYDADPDKVLANSFYDIFRDSDFGSRVTEPEYNVADCSGWSLVFGFSTDGF